MQKQFISHELALKLRELGFDEECMGWYVPHGPTGYMFTTLWNNIKCYPDHEVTPVPLWQQAFDWFREKHDILSLVSYFDTGDKRIFFFMIITKNKEIQYDNTNLHDGGYETYEEARLDCLKKLIELIQN